MSAPRVSPVVESLESALMVCIRSHFTEARSLIMGSTKKHTHLRRQTFMAKKGEVAKQWRTVDATDQSLGRLASDIATVLMGKHRPEYTPHVDCGDFVIVTNASKVKLTGRKAQQKMR